MKNSKQQKEAQKKKEKEDKKNKKNKLQGKEDPGFEMLDEPEEDKI